MAHLVNLAREHRLNFFPHLSELVEELGPERIKFAFGHLGAAPSCGARWRVGWGVHESGLPSEKETTTMSRGCLESLAILLIVLALVAFFLWAHVMPWQ